MKRGKPPRRRRLLRRNRARWIKTPEQIEGIRKACQLTASILDRVETWIEPGVTTEDINTRVHEATLAAGATPAPLGYRGFPKSVCTSVNEVVCHGIPGRRTLQQGDIINVDVTSILDGFYGDASRMYAVGPISEEAEALIEITRECLQAGIDAIRPGGHIGDIGHAIQSLAEPRGYSVVRDFVGHGIGLRFHEEPQVPHFGRPGTGAEIEAGMVFTVEPMINLGDWRVRLLKDDWTVVTVDGSLSAQWEHTLLITEAGAEPMT